jgi:hypothetical protein
MHVLLALLCWLSSHCYFHTQHALEIQLQGTSYAITSTGRKQGAAELHCVLLSGQLMCRLEKKQQKLITKGLLGHYGHSSYWMVGQVNSLLGKWLMADHY